MYGTLRAAAIAVAVSAVASCVVDEDCSLNGVCNNSVCQCDAGWVGSDCGALDFAPATMYSGYNLTGQGTSSWGGKTVRDPKNPALFHLFAAEFTGGCGLDYWSPMSRIIRATGSSPEGPFTLAAEVVGTFAHNPTVIWSPQDQLWLMYHIGCPVAQPSSCVQPSFTCDNNQGNNINGESSITMRTSPDLINWSEFGVVLSAHGNSTDNYWDTDTTNPSAFPIFNSSAILLAYRGCPYNCGGDELISLSMASNFKGPYTRITGQPLFPNGNEDPHVYQDKRGNWHLLMHSLEAGGGFGGGPKVGRHAFSRDFMTVPWTFNNNTLAYNTTVNFNDGSQINFYRRERPQLFFSDDGLMTPLYLTTGVQENGQSNSYTMIVPLSTAAEWKAKNGLQ